MRISEQAKREKEDKLSSIEINGAWFGGEYTGQLAAAPMAFFTPHKFRHEWVVLTTTRGSVYCIQFSGSDQSKAEVALTSHSSQEAANKAGMNIVGAKSYHPVQEERKIYNRTLEDVINFVCNFDEKYNMVTNNCQTLTSRLYAEFATINSDEIISDHRRAFNTPGFSRTIDGGVTIMCKIM